MTAHVLHISLVYTNISAHRRTGLEILAGRTQISPTHAPYGYVSALVLA